MKKIYLATLLAMHIGAYAKHVNNNHQEKLNQNVVVTKKPSMLAAQNNPALYAVQANASLNAVPFYTENFSSGTTTTVPTGWTVNNSTGGTANWKWRIGGGQGGFPVAALAASALTTPANGSMLFDSDNLCGTTGVSYTARLVSPTINCLGKASVKLSFQESYTRFQDSTFVEVSNNGGVSYTKFPVTYNNALAANASSTNPKQIDINISSVAANSQFVKLRFIYKGGATAGCDYGWIVDDISLSELSSDDLVMGIMADAFYYAVPLAQADTMFFTGIVNNAGNATQTQAKIDVDIKKVGQPIITTLSSGTLPIAAGSEDTLSTNNFFVPTSTGVYRSIYRASNNGVTDVSPLNNNDSTQFEVTDSTYWTANNITGSYYLYNPTATTTTNYNWGFLFDILQTDSISSVSISSITNTTNLLAGNTIQFDLFEFIGTNWVGINSVQKTVLTTEMSATAATLKDIKAYFTNAGGSTLLTPGSYAVVVSSVTTNGAQTLLATSDFPVNQINVLYDNTVTTGSPFSRVDIAPLMKVNLKRGNIITNVGNVKINNTISIYPNPANDFIFINTVNKSGISKIFDLNGKVVKEENLSNNTMSKLDISDLAKGIYNVQVITTDGNQMIKRIVKN
jgi:hypothetical protein